MYWKTPPETPGHLEQNCTRARAVFGSCDMNENHGQIDDLDPNEIPPDSYTFSTGIYLFHRSENLGGLVSHVYLHDEGQVPISVQANDMLATIEADKDAEEVVEKTNQFLEMAKIDAENRKQNLPKIRAQMREEFKTIPRLIVPVEGAEIENPKGIMTRIMGFIGMGR